MVHEFDGKKYESASGHQMQWGAKLLDELALEGHEDVLDLGCGNGALTVQLADRVPRGSVVGIDASRGMIEATRTHERPNLQFRLMDINALDFIDRFDVVFSNAALHWVKNHDRLLVNIHRALRVGGRFRGNFAGDGNCSHLFHVVREAMAREEFQADFTDFEWPWFMPPVDEYRSLAESSPLGHVRVWEENADRYFPDAESLVGWLDQPSLVPFLAHVAVERRARFREYVVTRMLEETQAPGGRFFETFRRINVSATK